MVTLAHLVKLPLERIITNLINLLSSDKSRVADVKWRGKNHHFFTYISLKSIVLEPVIPMTRKSMFKFSLRTAACTIV